MRPPSSSPDNVFHVQVKRSHHRANAFNLDVQTLRTTVVEPWLDGVPLRLGDREWPPQQSSLRILEGRRLPPPDLAHGQGWNRAERAGRDVTRELLAEERPGQVALVVAEPADAEAGRQLVAALDATANDWNAVREQLLAGETPPAAVVLVLVPTAPSPSWYFDAGLAAGAFGARAIFVAASEAAEPDAIAGLRDRLNR